MNTVENSNQSARNELLIQIGNYEIDYEDLDTAIAMYASSIYDCLNKTTVFTYDAPAEAFEYALSMVVYFQEMLQMIFLDAYKYNTYKMKHLMEHEEDVLDNLEITYITSGEELMETITREPQILVGMIRNAYFYQFQTELNKALMVRSLTDMENDKLKGISRFHEEDLSRYGKDTIFTFDRLVNDYKEKYDAYTELYGDGFQDILNKGTISSIIELSTYDKKNADLLCLEIAWHDYIESTELLNKVVDYKPLEEHIKFYRSASKDEIINKLLTDSNFFELALFNALDEAVLKEYVTGEKDYSNDPIRNKFKM